MQLNKENILNNIPKNTPGIYCIKNKINNKYYIGQSINVRARLLFHVNKSHLALHQLIHRAINEYGINNFEFNILILLNNIDIKNKLDFWEKYYIKKFNSYGKNGYNLTTGGDKGVLGLKHTDITKQRIRETNLEKTKRKYNMECWIYDVNSKSIYHIDHIYEIRNVIKNGIRSDIIKILDKNNITKSRGCVYAKTKDDLNSKIKYIELNKEKFHYIITEELRQKLRMSKSKYIYHQYDLNMQLISTYYLNDLKNNFGKLTNRIRNYCNEKPKLINGYYWIKKYINT